MSSTASVEVLREEWLNRLNDLVSKVEQWATALGWATKRIQIARNDSQIGKYQAPALGMQDDAIRILLEPVARSAPGAQGVVDLYLMPGLDDVASLFHYDGDWHIHFSPSNSDPIAGVREGEATLLTKESLRTVLDALKQQISHSE